MSRPKSTSRKGRKATPPPAPLSATEAALGKALGSALNGGPVDLDAKRRQRKQLDAAVTAQLRTNGKGRRGARVIVPASEDQKPAEAPATAAPPVSAPVQEEVGPAESIVVTAEDLKPFLAIAPLKDKSRPYLSGVYVHKTADNELRLIATDGQRMLVSTFEHKEPLSWGEAGIILPAEQLGRIMKYVGSSDQPIKVSFGRAWKTAEIETIGAKFTVYPIEGKYPDYTRVLEGVGDVFSAEREPIETSVINPKFLKAAGAIGTMLGAEGVFCYVGSNDKAPIAFTFAKVPGVLLIVMPIASGSESGLTASVAKLVGEKGMSGTLAALRAHETRQRKAGNEEGANRFAARIAEILKGVQPALAAPTTGKEAQA